MTRSDSAVPTARLSKKQRGRYRLPAVVAVAMLLAVGVVPAVGVMAQAQGASAPAAGASVASGSAAASSSLDHFLCYRATSTAFAHPTVRLINQFSPAPGITRGIGSVGLHCNPTRKTVPAGTTNISNPNAHLLCVGFTNTTGVSPLTTVQVSNQFGTALLQIQRPFPNSLCLPSWKNQPTKPAPGFPPGLSHFACYAVRYAPGTAPFQPPAPIRVKDQFSTQPVIVHVGAPQQLCVPTTKVVGNHTYPMQNPQAHLVCFGVSATPIQNPVTDQNQFGRGTVHIIAAKQLCLPSTKVPYSTAGCTNSFESQLMAATPGTPAFQSLAWTALQDGCAVYTSTTDLNLEFIRGALVGQSIVIGPTGLTLPRALEDIAMTSSGTIYGVDGDITNNVPPQYLYTISPVNGHATLVSPNAIAGLSGDIVNALVVGPDGTKLWASGGSGAPTANLYTINPTGTPTASLVGSTLPYFSAGDLAFSQTGKLFMTAAGAADSLVELSITTGAPVSPFPGPITTPTTPAEHSFGVVSSYGTVFAAISPQPVVAGPLYTRLVKLDPVTRVGTQQGPTDSTRVVGGMASPPNET